MYSSVVLANLHRDNLKHVYTCVPRNFWSCFSTSEANIQRNKDKRLYKEKNVRQNVRSYCSVSVANTQQNKGVPIAAFFSGKSVLITGCTGFLGQGLLEKLLRSCPDIGTMYVSIKPNRHGNTYQRFEQLIQYKVFDQLRKNDPYFYRKIVPFNGDVTHGDIGLSGDLYTRVTEDVSVIFHSAALIKLNPPLRDSVEANVLGSQHVFKLARKCRNLSAYVHISSLFTNMELDHIKEEVYPTGKAPDDVIDIVRRLSKQELRTREKDLTGTSPSVYVYSKKISERILTEERSHFPTAVFRPPFITPAICEPFPTWAHGYAGYCGIFHNVNKGQIRHIAGIPETPVELLPVDTVVNSLIHTGWYLGTGKHNDNETLVVNVHSSGDNPVTLGHIARVINTSFSSRKGERPIRLSIVTSRWEHVFWLATSYVFPAVLKDRLAVLRGETPSNLEGYLRMRKGLKYLETSTFNNATKDFNNAKLMYSQLCDSDKKDFPFDVKSIQWTTYLRSWVKMLQKNRRDG